MVHLRLRYQCESAQDSCPRWPESYRILPYQVTSIASPAIHAPSQLLSTHHRLPPILQPYSHRPVTVDLLIPLVHPHLLLRGCLSPLEDHLSISNLQVLSLRGQLVLLGED